MLYLKFGWILRFENHIPCIFEYKIPRFRRYTRLKPWITTAFLISGRGERIRTFDILLPKQALYQTELRPETGQIIPIFFIIANFSCLIGIKFLQYSNNG